MNTLPLWQMRVADFVEEHVLDASIEARLLDLASEVGELAKEALEATDYGNAPFVVPDTWADEMGDVFFSLICLANQTDIDLEAVLGAVLVKYQHRLALVGDIGSGM